MKTALRLAAGTLAAMLLATAAQAATLIGLVDGKTLVWVDPATKKVTGKADITGAGTILGIDVRPADGALYGLTADGNLVTIDPKTGKATVKSKLSEMLKPGGTVTFDFNPAADRLRLMSSDGTSLRINVDDGKVTVDGSHKFKDGDVNAGKTPKVVAGAYTNSVNPKPTATALYNIDATTWTLVSQAPPNDGVLNTIGALGISVNGPVAFNIVASAGDKNDAWLVTGGTLYSVDLKSGKATMAGKIQGLTGSLTDIAWIDE
jgi:Cu/Ag efflux protein CusF